MHAGVSRAGWNRILLALLGIGLWACQEGWSPASLRQAIARKVIDSGDPLTNRASLQKELDAATPGDLILLQPGMRIGGRIDLPARPGSTQYIELRTELPGVDRAGKSWPAPADGHRVGPTQQGAFAIFEHVAPGETIPKTGHISPHPAIAAKPGAGYYKIRWIEVKGYTGSPDGLFPNVIELGDGSLQTLAEVPHHLIFDQILATLTDATSVRRFFQLNASDVAITNSYLAGISARATTGWADTDVIASWNTPGNIRIENNYLESSGENIIFGGAAGRWPISNITIRRNYLPKRWSWNAKHPSYSGVSIKVKNSFELKTGEDVLFEGNVVENMWADAQSGRVIVLTPRQEMNDSPLAVRRVTIRCNKWINGGTPAVLLGRDDVAWNSYHYLRDVTIEQNLFVGLAHPYGSSTQGFILLPQVNPGGDAVERNEKWIFRHNTLIEWPARTHNTFMALDGKAASLFGLVVKDNLFPFGTYGLHSSTGSGIDALDAYAANPYVFSHNVIGGTTDNRYNKASTVAGAVSTPNHLLATTAEYYALFVDRAAGNYRLKPGTPHATGASDGTAIGADIDLVDGCTKGVVEGLPAQVPARDGGLEGGGPGREGPVAGDGSQSGEQRDLAMTGSDPGPRPSDGCSCQAGSAPAALPGSLLLFCLLALALVRRPRGRRDSIRRPFREQAR